MATARFSMVKWYLDCVTDAGESAILYSARVEGRDLRLSYSNLLRTDGQARNERTSLCVARIVPSGDTIAVKSTQFDFHGEWTAIAAPVEHIVYQSDLGSVVWNCLQPAATVRLTIGGRTVHGLGYAECLTLTLPPWKLPMQQLRWGRFVSPRDALAWIDWQGPYSMSLVVHNGVQMEKIAISDSAVSLPGATLRIEDPVPIRSGRLATTILPGAPVLAGIFPRSIFNVDEKKWRSRGALETPNHRSDGWVIHEVVEWSV